MYTTPVASEKQVRQNNQHPGLTQEEVEQLMERDGF